MVSATRLFYALLLSLSLLASSGLRIGHRLFDCEHHQAPLCLAKYDKAHPYHLHDERYSVDFCWACAFLFSTLDLPTGVPIIVFFSLEISNEATAPLKTIASAQLTSKWSRAPPHFE
ncbi:MAG: hypothetical protein NZM43_07890 [Saprospiraceae bacterium]|nr:hypothetical protein [Saprospiraceae bacterium]MDW8484228.1 hypothetical protein [Saprospiraceae bacterium]